MNDLTKKEEENVRAALRYLHVRFETWENVAGSVGVSRELLRRVLNGGYVTASVAFRVARRAGATVDDVLSGRFPSACPHCGQNMPAKDE